MSKSLSCPLCEDRCVSFSGTKATLIIGATCEWAAVFVCGNSHMFSVLMADAAPILGHDFKVVRFGDLQKTLNRARNTCERIGQVQVQMAPPQLLGARQRQEWRKLQAQARAEKSIQKLGLLMDRMNALLGRCEAAQSRRAVVPKDTSFDVPDSLQ